MLSGFIYLLIAVCSFLLVLSFLVFFHELGHYGMARLFNVSVEKFSIGYGKPIWSYQRASGERWMVARIPLGGYVKFVGDMRTASNPDAEGLAEIEASLAEGDDTQDLDNVFHFRPLWQRVLIVLAGPFANFLLAVVLFASVAFVVGDRYLPSVVGEVIAGSPAEKAGFLPGDEILTMDGQDAMRFSSVQQHVQLRGDTNIETKVLRDGFVVTLQVRPERETIRDFVGGEVNVGRIGLGLSSDATYRRDEHTLFSAVEYGVRQVGDTLQSSFLYLGRIFTGKEDGKQLGSVVKIGTVVGKVAADTATADMQLSKRVKMWFLRITLLAGSISIALGFANLMPLPMLDGGHLLYYGYEAIAGRPLSQKKQEFGFRLGFAILLILFVLLTINDIGYVGSIFF